MSKALSKVLLIPISALLLILVIPYMNIRGQQLQLTINNPRNDERVCWQTIVEGTISDHRLQVFIAIHPMATDRFWIQPIPNMSSDGRWSSLCFFGESRIGIGEPFEIIAIGSNNRRLFREGNTLSSPLPENPEILVRSRSIGVIRDPCIQR